MNYVLDIGVLDVKYKHSATAVMKCL